MSDNKLVKPILDAATLTGLAAGIGWVAKKGLEREFHVRPQQQRNELRAVQGRYGRKHCA